MGEKNSILYDEYFLSVSDVEFEFFADSGFLSRGTYLSEEHYHQYNEIIYCFKGSLEVVCDAGVKTLGPKDIVVIPGKISHSLSADDDTLYLVMSFWGGEKWQSVRVFTDFAASDAFGRILEYHYGDYRYKKELINSCIYEIITMMLEMSDSGGAQTQKTVTLENNSYRRYIIEQYIQSNYKASPSVAELAGLLHLSVPQTQRIIKKLYNQTFTDKVLSLRMNKAKKLISQTDMPVIEIAAAVGYNNAHNFFSAFKRETGVAPKQYRKKFT